VTGLVFGGIFTDALTGAVAALLACTGLLAGAARYVAVLVERSEREVERATAIGFFFGFGLGTMVLVIDSLT
jgi:hypothetical protein